MLEIELFNPSQLGPGVGFSVAPSTMINVNKASAIPPV